MPLSFLLQQQRITDETARADFLRGGSPLGGLFGFSDVSPEQLAAQVEQNVTLTAVDLERLPDLMSAVNDFVYALQEEDQSLVAEPKAGGEHIRAARGNSHAFLYLPRGGTVIVRPIAFRATQWRAWWFAPRSGEAQDAGLHPARDSLQFAAPSFGARRDWVLVLDNAAESFPAPGNP